MNPAYRFYLPARILASLLTIMVLLSCNGPKEKQIDYLGQKPPGKKAELFAHGIISTNAMEHSAPAFAPDGSIVVWTVLTPAYRAFLLEMVYKDGKWSAPQRPSFADSTADDYYPSFSADGKKLYFSSRREAPPFYSPDIDMRIWEVERTPTGWGTPTPFDTLASPGHEYAHATAKDGTLYFSSPHEGGTSLNLYKAEKQNGHYTPPALLPYSINSAKYEDGIFVAPDESFLVFESDRPEGIEGSIDLYISFKGKDGRWSIPLNMGAKINSAYSERFAGLSPDGKYFFFGSSRNQSATNIGFDIFWIDAKVIDDLKKQTPEMPIEQPLGDEIIRALYKNNTEASAALLKQWLSLYPASLDAAVMYSAALRKQKQYTEAEGFLTKKTSQWSENASIIIETALIRFGLNKDEEALKLVAPLLNDNNLARERYIYLSEALLDMGGFEKSDAYFEEAMAIAAGSFPWYSRGRAYALIGNKDKAFAALNNAAGYGGYNLRGDYEADPALQSLRADPRWKVLMGKLK